MEFNFERVFRFLATPDASSGSEFCDCDEHGIFLGLERTESVCELSEFCVL